MRPGIDPKVDYAFKRITGRSWTERRCRRHCVGRAQEELAVVSQYEVDRERQRMRLQLQRDELSLLHEIRLVRREAYEAGYAQGLEEGECISKIQAYERQLKRTITPHERLLALPLDELRRRADELARTPAE